MIVLKLFIVTILMSHAADTKSLMNEFLNNMTGLKNILSPRLSSLIQKMQPKSINA